MTSSPVSASAVSASRVATESAESTDHRVGRSAGPDDCRLTLLGSFGLDHADETIAANDSSARLLAFLAVHGRDQPVRRSVAADKLWGDGTSARAQARLRTVIWRLPRPAGQPLLRGTPTTVQLAHFVSVDVWDAEDAARGEGADADPAVFRRDLLPDWPDDWLVLEREAFRQTRLHALERTSTQLRLSGSYDAALQAALAAVACEPLRETAHRRVIEVHLAEGNHAEALRQYHSFRRLLAVDLGLPPSPGIRALVAPLLGRPVDQRA